MMLIRKPEMLVPLLLLVASQATKAETLPWMIEIAPIEMTRQECVDSNGAVVADVGDGSSRLPDYRCASNGKEIIAVIYTLPGEYLSDEGEVCCGRDKNEENPPISLPLPEEPLPQPPSFMERPLITIDECRSAGGGVVGDPGNGSVHRAEYTCESNGEKPIGTIVPASNNEPVFIEGAVCCGPPPPRPPFAERPPMTTDECRSEGGEVVGDPGTGSVHQSGYTCESNGEKPLGTIVPASNNEPIFIEGAVCCGPLPAVPPPTVMTRQECRESNGVVVGDIGDGSSRRPNYRCPTDGKSIMGIIVPLPGEPIAREGEVCCGAPEYQEPMIVSFKECTEDLSGMIVYDIGNGSSHRPGYRCENTGEPILAIIVPAEGEPRPREGAVCCGAGDIASDPSFPELTRDECELEYDGIVIGDMGDGATIREDYRCVTNGEPIVGVIVASSEFDFIAFDGEVCCQLPGNLDEGDALGDNCQFMCQMIAWSNSLKDWIDGFFDRD